MPSKNKVNYNQQQFFQQENQWIVELKNVNKLSRLDKPIKIKLNHCIEILIKNGTNFTQEDMRDFNFKVDSIIHNRFHNHIRYNHTDYIALWQFNKKTRQIYLIEVAPHENFNFKQTFKAG